MKIDRQAFEAWARGVFPADETFSLSKVAAAAGVSKSTFFLQSSRGGIDASIVVDYSRAIDIDPLEQLVSFPELRAFGDPRNPTELEVLSQVNPEAFMEELLGRSRGRPTPHNLEPMPEPYALKRWMDTYDLWGKYDEIATAMGLSSAKSLTRKVAENKVTLGELLSMCQAADLTPRFGLAVTGILTLAEAGYAKDLREQVLRTASTPTVIEALSTGLRWLEKQVQVKELSNDFYRNLS